MEDRNVVICIIKNKGKILLLKRRPDDKIYPDRWNFICGVIDPGETPIKTAYREIEEESGIQKNNLKLLKKGEPYTRVDRNLSIIFHNNIFLLKSDTNQIELDHENTDYTWIDPNDIFDYYLAPGMLQAYIKLMGSLPTRQGIMALVYRNLDSFLVVETKNENVSFIAGGIDKEETPMEAVIREVEEESGIKVERNQIKELPLVNEFTYPKGFYKGVNSRQKVFLIKVPEDSSIEHGGEEIIRAEWMTKNEVRRNLSFNHVKDIFEKSLEYI
ncbi:MAG: NUDIX domain-containing protein [Candidatus Aenigmarchaeota archaeon]|nr:NUDIX domain-containing protein [Candidatus Aenigmarchaeota archaeon]